LATSPEAASRTVSLMTSGTPSAVVVEEPKLERMSLRTMPESSSTLGPFDPSPGYGPPVSSGTLVRSALPEDEPVVPEVELGAEVVPFEAEPCPVVPEAPHAASRAAAPTPPNRPRTRRRSTSVRRS
jgi:hypothetical protein